MTTLTITNTFTSGTTIQSAQVNTNFTDVVNWSTNIDNTNIKAAAGIVRSKLDQTVQDFIKRAAGNSTFASGVTGDTNPRAELMSDGYVRLGAGTSSVTDLELYRVDANTLGLRNVGATAHKTIQLDIVNALTYADANPKAQLSTSGLKLGAGGASALDLLVEREDANTVAVRNAADTAYKDLKINNLIPATVTATGIYHGDGTKMALTTGTALQSWRVNSGATAIEAYTPSATKYTIIAKSAAFTANDASGTFYSIDATSAITVTMNTSPADGTVYKFARTAGSSDITFNRSGADNIFNAGTTDTSLTQSTDGIIEMVAITGGWTVS